MSWAELANEKSELPMSCAELSEITHHFDTPTLK